MGDSPGERHEPFEGLILDDAFVRGGQYEPPARTREAIARLAGQDTSWRRPAAPPAPGGSFSPHSRRQAATRRSWPVSALFVGLVAVLVAALLGAWQSGSRVAVFVVVVAGWLVSLCLHEFAHAVAAYAGGDRSVRLKGYLRLDIRRYAHPVTSFILPVLFVVLGGIGLPGGAVWIDHAALHSRRLRSLTSLAGPATNAACAVVCLVPPALAARSDATLVRHLPFWSALAFLGFLQVTATIINLLPVPGLDGWGVLEPYLPPHVVDVGRRIAPFGALILFFLLFRFASVSGQLGDAVGHVGSAVGVPSWLAGWGYHLFRFWSS